MDDLAFHPSLKQRIRAIRIRAALAVAVLAVSAGAGACDVDFDDAAQSDIGGLPAYSPSKGGQGTISLPLAKVISANAINPLTQAAEQLTQVTPDNASAYKLPEAAGDSWGWPTEYDDMGTDQAVISWQLLGDSQHSIGELAQLVLAQNGITLSVNGNHLKRGASASTNSDYSVSWGAPGCPSGGLCFTTTIYRKGWPKQHWWGANIKTFELVFGNWENDFPVVFFVVPMAYPASYFLSNMEPTFKHIRCGMCHSLESVEDVITQHGGVAGFNPVNVTLQPSPNFAGDRVTCNGTNGCHTQQIEPVPGVTFPDTAWITPAANMHINWFTLTGEQICDKITANLQTEQELTSHFHGDGRQAWAVHSGIMPGGGPLQTAPPNDYFDWLDIVDPWIAAGAPCPPGPPPIDQIAYATGCSALHQPYSAEWWGCINGA